MFIGAGYVLSRKALQLFIKKGVSEGHTPKCKESDDDGSEDVEMGLCLEAVGVTTGDSRDNLGRGRFFPLVPEEHITRSAEVKILIFSIRNINYKNWLESSLVALHVHYIQWMSILWQWLGLLRLG